MSYVPCLKCYESRYCRTVFIVVIEIRLYCHDYRIGSYRSVKIFTKTRKMHSLMRACLPVYFSEFFNMSTITTCIRTLWLSIGMHRTDPCFRCSAHCTNHLTQLTADTLWSAGVNKTHLLTGLRLMTRENIAKFGDRWYDKLHWITLDWLRRVNAKPGGVGGYSERFWRGCAARVFATIPLATETEGQIMPLATESGSKSNPWPQEIPLI